MPSWIAIRMAKYWRTRERREGERENGDVMKKERVKRRGERKW